jgi:hypothetical protein
MRLNTACNVLVASAFAAFATASQPSPSASLRGLQEDDVRCCVRVYSTLLYVPCTHQALSDILRQDEDAGEVYKPVACKAPADCNEEDKCLELLAGEFFCTPPEDDRFDTAAEVVVDLECPWFKACSKQTDCCADEHCLVLDDGQYTNCTRPSDDRYHMAPYVLIEADLECPWYQNCNQDSDCCDEEKCLDLDSMSNAEMFRCVRPADPRFEKAPEVANRQLFEVDFPTRRCDYLRRCPPDVHCRHWQSYELDQG